MSRTLWAAAVVLACGCAPEREAFKMNMDAAWHFYQNARFGEAFKHYSLAVDEDTGHFGAMYGLACSAAEQSHVMYAQAEEAIFSRKKDMAARILQEGDRFTELANKSFHRCFQMRSGDTAVNYSFGLFLYKRATSVRHLPYPASEEVPPEYKGTPFADGWKKGVLQRRAELDKAIEQFLVVLKGDPPGIGTTDHIRRCKSSQAHRYLGLAFYLRSDWGRRDGDIAREHLLAFLTYVQDLREGVIAKWPAATDQDKAAKEKEMKRLETDLQEVRTLLIDRVKALKDYDATLRAGREDPRLDPAERERRLAAIAVEVNGIDALFRKMDSPKNGPKGQ